MILLDTNVVSEPLRTSPAAEVVTWLDRQAVDTLYLSTIVLAEIRYGIAAMPGGQRRERLHERFEGEVVAVFGGRILSFDVDASAAYADLRATARSQGGAIGDQDALIAGIAAARRLTVATRDTAPFEAAGVAVVNPFEPDASR